MFEDEYREATGKKTRIDFVMSDASLLLPPTGTPLTGERATYKTGGNGQKDKWGAPANVSCQLGAGAHGNTRETRENGRARRSPYHISVVTDVVVVSPSFSSIALADSARGAAAAADAHFGGFREASLP